MNDELDFIALPRLLSLYYKLKVRFWTKQVSNLNLPASSLLKLLLSLKIAMAGASPLRQFPLKKDLGLARMVGYPTN